MSKTRRLAFSAAIDKILEQWIELKAYFSIVAGGQEKSYMAKTLSSKYNDDLLYLIFLRSILKEISRVNLIFQSESAEVIKSFEDLRAFHWEEDYKTTFLEV